MTENDIYAKHQEDKEQLEFIFSNADHVSVVAPAGCGKTTAMISKIAYELSTNRIPLNKKILAMTFSVSGALKIKEAVETLLPAMVNNAEQCLEKIDIANYHRFAVQLITKHGYYLNRDLIDFRSFQILDDKAFCSKCSVSEKEKEIITSFLEVITNADVKEENQIISNYWNVLVHGFAEHIITYNGLLVTAILLLQQDHIRHFYTSFYRIVLVDEFQDTNILGYMIVRLLIDKNRSIFLGDGMQKIYGFIGALPDAFSQLKTDLNIVEYKFIHNYRFAQSEMLKSLDAYIRNCCEQYHLSPDCEASINFRFLRTENDENDYIISKIKEQLTDVDVKIAILVRAAYQGNSIAASLAQQGIPFFNALYKESDPEYISFYSVACEEFHLATNGTQKATKRDLERCLSAINARKIEVCMRPECSYIFDSLFTLLSILFAKAKQWPGTTYDRYVNIDFILGNNGLKHMMEYLNERIVLTTIHSAKGLEWDYVFIPAMMAYSFPPSTFCQKCSKNNGQSTGSTFCSFQFVPDMKKIYQEELSVFYVALTRARKMMFLSANQGPNRWGYPQKRSCLTCLPGLKIES